MYLVFVKRVGAFLFLTLALSAGSWADEPKSSPATTSHSFYVGAGVISFDKSAADQELIDDSGDAFRFAWEARKQHLVYGAGLSFWEYDDSNDFSQTVQDYSGDVFDADSSASAVSFFGEVGYRFFPQYKVNLDAIAGYEFVVQSERSISRCSDCYSEDIDIDSGLYVHPRISIQASKNIYLSLGYQAYVSGDVEDSYSLMFGWQF